MVGTTHVNSNLSNLKLISVVNNYPSYATITGEMTVSDDTPLTVQQAPKNVALQKGKKYLALVMGGTSGSLTIPDTSIITHKFDLKTTMPGDIWDYSSVLVLEPTSDIEVTVVSFWGVGFIFEV